MQFEYADFFMQEMRLNNLQCHAVMPSSRSVAGELFVHARTSKLPVRSLFVFLFVSVSYRSHSRVSH